MLYDTDALIWLKRGNGVVADILENDPFRFISLQTYLELVQGAKDRRQLLFARRFLAEFSSANGNRVTGITPAAMKLLESYDWPGNVRELRNAVERMVVLSPGGQLDVGDVPDFSRAPSVSPALQVVPAGTLEETEKARILAALEQARGNRSLAAKLLGISRRTLYRKIDEYAKEGIRT